MVFALLLSVTTSKAESFFRKLRRLAFSCWLVYWTIADISLAAALFSNSKYSSEYIFLQAEGGVSTDLGSDFIVANSWNLKRWLSSSEYIFSLR